MSIKATLSFSIFFLYLGCVVLFSQALRCEPFYGNNSTQKELEKKRIHTRMEEQWVLPAHFQKDSKKIFDTERAQLETELGTIIDKKALFDDVLYPYVKAVHAKIISANPSLPLTQVIVIAEATPNAFSVGEGTLVVHTGLLAELENEAQLNFVLCHEIAHYVLQHTIKQLTGHIEHLQSKEFQNELKKIQASQYNQFDLFESLVQKMQFKSRYHNRLIERQADSLAYHLFIHTDANPNQAQRLMQLFQDIDEPLKDSLLNFEPHFGCSKHPYKKSWEQQKKSVWASAVSKQNVARQSLRDSLKTHPDALLRMKWLDSLATNHQVKTLTTTASEGLGIRRVSAIESVEAAYRDHDYDWAIYTALLHQKTYPEIGYFKDIVALCIGELYTHSKNHTLSDVLAQTSIYYSPRYNQFLSLLNNFSLSDLLLVRECLEANTSGNSEYGLFAKYLYAQISGDSAASQEAKKKYLQQYPDGRFKQNFSNGN
jgi:Zn-dependent protease with chaperone function